MVEIGLLIAIAVGGTLLFNWLKWRKLERDPRQMELANHLVRLANEPYATPLQLHLFVTLQGWSGRETANRIAHALGIPEQYMPPDQWKHTRAVGMAIGRDYRFGRIKT